MKNRSSIRRGNLFLAFVLALLFAGCSILVETGGLQTYKKGNFSVELPQGWMRNRNGNGLMMSKDGLTCQLINAFSDSIYEDMEDLPKQFDKDMLPHEQAETYIDLVKSNKARLNFSVEDNSPAKLGGKSGFRVVYTFNYQDGPKIKDAVYGFLHDEKLHIIRYEAPVRYYFDKDLHEFEKIVETYKVLK